MGYSGLLERPKRKRFVTRRERFDYKLSVSNNKNHGSSCQSMALWALSTPIVEVDLLMRMGVPLHEVFLRC